MWLYDFHLFYQGAQAVLHSQSPYQVWDFNGPYPLALLFVPFALFPERVAYGIYLALVVFLLWKVMGRRMVWALLAFPVLFQLYVGQIDTLLVLIILLGAPYTIPLAMVKPQVGFVVLPWLLFRLSKKEWIKVIAIGVLILGISFILQPNWVAEWMQAQPGMILYSRHASNIYWLIPYRFANWRVIASIILAIVCLPIAFLAKERKISWPFLQLFAPLTNIYSAGVLLEWFGPIEVILSWIAVVMVKGDIHSGMPMFIVTLCILIRNLWHPRISDRSILFFQRLRAK